MALSEFEYSKVLEAVEVNSYLADQNFILKDRIIELETKNIGLEAKREELVKQVRDLKQKLIESNKQLEELLAVRLRGVTMEAEKILNTHRIKEVFK